MVDLFLLRFSCLVLLWLAGPLTLAHEEAVCSSLDGPYCAFLTGADIPDWGRALKSKIGPAVAYNPNNRRRN
jgi:hypothetical protein